jgi:hypothetical protein
MRYAVELYFDAATEPKVRPLWDRFAAFGFNDMVANGARPHISVAIADTSEPQTFVRPAPLNCGALLTDLR